MPDLNEEAELWRTRVREGFASVQDVRAWADGHIARLEHPPAWLLDACMASDPWGVDKALKEAGEKADPDVLFRMRMRGYREILERDSNADSRIARALYLLGLSGDGPESESGELVSFWGAIDLAKDGIYGDPHEERQRLREFLERQGRE